MNRFSTFLGLAVGLVIWLGIPSEAQAADRFFVGVNIGAQQPHARRVWVPGTHVARTERVLVQDAHYVNQWVPPLYETRYNRFGRPYTVCVRKGHHVRVLVPARYEMRTVQHWVPGYWREVCAPQRPVFSFLFGNGDRHGRYDGRYDGRRDDCHDDRRGHAGIRTRF